MKLVSRSSLLSAAVATLMLLGVQALSGQDYVQFETRYLNPLPGHFEDLAEALGDHNRRFHSEGAYAANVYRVTTGARAGQLLWVMGPGTFTQWDSRPADAAHGSDWTNKILVHAREGRVDYWRQMGISSTVDTGGEVRPLQRVRFFSVENEGAWRRSQTIQEEASGALGNTRSRTFYDRQFVDPDAPNFALVQQYRNWSEVDQGGRTGGFNAVLAKMIELHGSLGYDQYREDREAAGITILDEWHMLMPALRGAGGGN